MRHLNWAVAPLGSVTSLRTCWKLGSHWSCLSRDWMASSASWLQLWSALREDDDDGDEDENVKTRLYWSQKAKVEVTLWNCESSATCVWLQGEEGHLAWVCVCVCGRGCVCVSSLIGRTLWGAAGRVWPAGEVSHPLQGQNSLAGFLAV